MTKKNNIIAAFLILLFCIGFISYTNNDISTASMLSNDEVIATINLGEGEMTYYQLSVVESEIPISNYISKTTEQTLDLGSGSKDFDSGVTSDGTNVKGSIETEYALKFQPNSIGYVTNVVKQTTIPYVSKVAVSGIFSSIDAEYSNVGASYYKLDSANWNYVADYKPTVTIKTDDGEKTYTATYLTTDVKNSQILYKVEGTSPTIYYVEQGLLNTRSTSTAPTLKDLSIFKRSNGLFFMDTSDYTPDEVLGGMKYGDGVYGNYALDANNHIVAFNYALSQYAKTIDWNNDGTSNSKDVDLLPQTITLDRLCNEKFSQNSYKKYGFIPTTDAEVATFKTFEYDGINDIENYNLISDSELLYVTDMSIIGTWYIPSDYGNVEEIFSTTNPEIIDINLVTDLYSDGATVLEATIKNNGNSGKVVAWLEHGETESVSFGDTKQEIFIASGETEVVEFSLVGNDIIEDELLQSVTVCVEGSTGLYNELDYSFILTNSKTIPKEERQYISITAVNGNNKLPDMLITVLENDDTQAGNWTGYVNIGTVAIKGYAQDGFIPVTTEINVVEGQTSYFLEYETEYISGLIDSASDSTNWLLYIMTILAFTAIGYIGYTKLGKKKGGKK
jgi:hypothetical protein